MLVSCEERKLRVYSSFEILNITLQNDQRKVIKQMKKQKKQG